jgi:hypothetical protein
MTSKRLWIHRNVANQIYERIVNNDGSVVVFLIKAPAGMGKTYLARDLGSQLGSETGYEPVRQGDIAWSGILDVYDPDTNSNPGIERRLIEALQQSNVEFDDYRLARELYDAWFKSGIIGPGLEAQRHKIEQAFAEGLHKVSQTCRPVIVLDTIERLESGTDPTQQEVADYYEDTASVVGWLTYQISQMRNGVVLLLGRRSDRLQAALEKTIAHSQSPIEFHAIELSHLDEAEYKDFLASRLELYPQLNDLLTLPLQQLLIERTRGNPLLLDLALQTLLEIGRPNYVQQVLASDHPEDLEGDLISAYMKSFTNVNRQALLRYLALARNGLTEDVLHVLEPQRASLLTELQNMADLPYLKVRTISFPVPGDKPEPRRTYFLHDAMYSICDEVLLHPQEVILDTERIVVWYDDQIKAIESAEGKNVPGMTYTRAAGDLYVQSLFYRMRVNPVLGLQWYLRLSDWAIRNGETSLDMRLRDAIGLFIESATPPPLDDNGQSLSSKIDRENVATLMPQLVTDLRLESATLWMKRLSVRGKNDRARELGYHLQPMADQIYASNPERYALAYADYQLWHGQVIMYSSTGSEALSAYERGINVIEQHYAAEARDPQRRQTALDEFAAWRLCLVLGRLNNNVGYTHWMYDGKFTLAVHAFQRAINLFRDANLSEELANSSDNMGRVYVALGQEFRAIQLIRNGLNLRHKMDLVYREALSNTSLALALSRFDRMAQAEQAADDALMKYRMAGVERGIGLGLLSRGEVYRLIADNWREAGLSDVDAARYAERTETDLREALRIFTSLVKEPIREVQARNAMGCFYRTRLLLLEHSDKPTPQNAKDLVFNQGRINFQEAIKVAKANGYLLEELDSEQDLAVLYFRAKCYADAEDRQVEMLKKIPPSYKLQPGNDRLPEVLATERIDAFYRLMGQVEQLFGAIAFDHGFTPASKVYPRARLMAGPDQVEAMLHYLLGVMYFNRFSKESFVHRQVYARIHKRFQECTPDTVREIRSHVPRWIEQHGLPEGLVTDLLQDVFGLFDF